jgi:ABC-type long-subunit fatty acid transport system fused permease/ATPase subunit
MYTVALFITMAILLEAVMTVLHSVLGTIGLSDTIGKLPIVGANLTLLIAILMVWLMGDAGYVLGGWR